MIKDKYTSLDVLYFGTIANLYSMSIYIVEDLNLRLRLGWGILPKPISCENNSSGGHIKKRKHKISVMLIYLFSGCESFLHFSHILFKLASIYIHYNEPWKFISVQISVTEPNECIYIFMHKSLCWMVWQGNSTTLTS